MCVNNAGFPPNRRSITAVLLVNSLFVFAIAGLILFVHSRERFSMQELPFFSEKSLVRLAQGAAIGIALVVAIGFNWSGYGFGWTLGGNVDKIARARSETAVINALAPGCAARLSAREDSAVMLGALRKATTAWDRRNEFRDEASKILITIPGESYPSAELADACAKLALKQTAAITK
jgi:hypothetical protein